MNRTETIEQNGIRYNVYHVAGDVYMAIKLGKRGQELKAHRPATRDGSGWRLHRWA